MARDWTPLRLAYVEGRAVDPDGDPTNRTWPTLDEVAATFGVSPGQVRHRAGHEKWTEQRERFQIDLDTERRRLVIEQRSKRSAAIDSHALQNTEAAMALLGQRLNYLVQQERTAVAGNPQGAGSTVSAAELAALGLAAQRWARVSALVQGRPEGAEVDDETARERAQQIGEELLAASLADHIARRDIDDDL